MNVFEEVCRLRLRGEAGVLITVVDKIGDGPATVGKKLLLCSTGRAFGTVGGGDLEHLALQKAKELLEVKSCFIEQYDFSGAAETGSAVKLNMVCGGKVTLYYEYIGAIPTVYIFGIGHVGKSLASMLERLDYNIVLIDDRESLAKEQADNQRCYFGDYSNIIEGLDFAEDCYMVVSSYSHEIEYQVLKALYLKGVKSKYIGLLASSNKAEYMQNKLKEELAQSPDFDNLYAPIGLDIGGKAPEEVALSIAAELQALRYNKTDCKHMTQKWA